MANNLTTQPAIVDTVMSVVSGLGLIYPVRVDWVNAATVGDIFTIVDSHGVNILNGYCYSIDHQTQSYELYRVPAWRDFKVTALTSGTLYITYRQ